MEKIGNQEQIVKKEVKSIGGKYLFDREAGERSSIIINQALTKQGAYQYLKIKVKAGYSPIALSKAIFNYFVRHQMDDAKRTLSLSQKNELLKTIRTSIENSMFKLNGARDLMKTDQNLYFIFDHQGNWVGNVESKNELKPLVLEQKIKEQVPLNKKVVLKDYLGEIFPDEKMDEDLWNQSMVAARQTKNKFDDFKEVHRVVLESEVSAESLRELSKMKGLKLTSLPGIKGYQISAVNLLNKKEIERFINQKKLNPGLVQKLTDLYDESYKLNIATNSLHMLKQHYQLLSQKLDNRQADQYFQKRILSNNDFPELSLHHRKLPLTKMMDVLLEPFCAVEKSKDYKMAFDYFSSLTGLKDETEIVVFIKNNYHQMFFLVNLIEKVTIAQRGLEDRISSYEKLAAHNTDLRVTVLPEIIATLKNNRMFLEKLKKEMPAIFINLQDQIHQFEQLEIFQKNLNLFSDAPALAVYSSIAQEGGTTYGDSEKKRYIVMDYRIKDYAAFRHVFIHELTHAIVQQAGHGHNNHSKIGNIEIEGMTDYIAMRISDYSNQSSEYKSATDYIKKNYTRLIFDAYIKNDSHHSLPGYSSQIKKLEHSNEKVNIPEAISKLSKTIYKPFVKKINKSKDVLNEKNNRENRSSMEKYLLDIFPGNYPFDFNVPFGLKVVYEKNRGKVMIGFGDPERMSKTDRENLMAVNYFPFLDSLVQNDNTKNGDTDSIFKLKRSEMINQSYEPLKVIGYYQLYHDEPKNHGYSEQTNHDVQIKKDDIPKYIHRDHNRFSLLEQEFKQFQEDVKNEAFDADEFKVFKKYSSEYRDEIDRKYNRKYEDLILDIKNYENIDQYLSARKIFYKKLAVLMYVNYLKYLEENGVPKEFIENELAVLKEKFIKKPVLEKSIEKPEVHCDKKIQPDCSQVNLNKNMSFNGNKSENHHGNAGSIPSEKIDIKNSIIQEKDLPDYSFDEINNRTDLAKVFLTLARAEMTLKNMNKLLSEYGQNIDNRIIDLENSKKLLLKNINNREFMKSLLDLKSGYKAQMTYNGRNYFLNLKNSGKPINPSYRAYVVMNNIDKNALTKLNKVYILYDGQLRFEYDMNQSDLAQLKSVAAKSNNKSLKNEIEDFIVSKSEGIALHNLISMLRVLKLPDPKEFEFLSAETFLSLENKEKGMDYKIFNIEQHDYLSEVSKWKKLQLNILRENYQYESKGTFTDYVTSIDGTVTYKKNIFSQKNIKFNQSDFTDALLILIKDNQKPYKVDEMHPWIIDLFNK